MIHSNLKDVPLLVKSKDGYLVKWGSGEFKIPKMKHGVIFLMVNQISTQVSFCEYRIHLDYAKGRVIGMGAVEGVEEHHRQLGGGVEDFSIEPGWDPVVINRGDEGVAFFNMRMRNWIGLSDFTRPYVEERSVVVLIDNVPILGLPDLILNRDGKPWFIIELKTTNRFSTVNSLNQREAFQAEAYFHMVRMLGLDIEGVAVLKIVRGLGYKLIPNIGNVVKAVELGQSKISSGVVLHRVTVGDQGSFLSKVKWALGYWLGERNAIPSPSPSKCRLCDHKLQCSYSQFRSR